MNCIKRLSVCLGLMVVAGCSSKPAPVVLSGKVTFKGAAVPAGWISFTPDAAAGTLGETKLFHIQNGVYDSSKYNPPGLLPGKYLVKIAGFDGKKIPFWGQGKQIFNPVDETFKAEMGMSTKDFVVPESAGNNVRIEKTADS